MQSKPLKTSRPLSLAAQFSREVKLRENNRFVSEIKLMAIAVMVLMVGTSFIPEPVLRRFLGIGLLGILLGMKGYASYAQWSEGTLRILGSVPKSSKFSR